jgi:[glutamine synthetase] adenylyltransferase / [glutamine synthetase]-adenylyl-L-tyrosine phosphorylase
MSADIKDLLLAARLGPDRVEALLRPYGFRDPQRADRELQAVAEDPSARTALVAVLEDLLRAAGEAADPDGALSRFERLARAGGSAARLLSHLQADPRMVDVLVRTLGGSPFLAEVLIRHPGWLYWLSEPDVLDRARTRDEMRADLQSALLPLHTEERREDALRLAKRREILHIGVRDLLRRATVEETIAALSDLAEALIEGALWTAEEGLRESIGLAGDEPRPPLAKSRGFTVVGMGKLGGRELNFSSDVDLVYVYDTDEGEVGAGAAAVSRGEYFRSLARRLTNHLASVTHEGYVYRVDLRLRPEGGAGSVAWPLAAFRAYYETRGATWERLALLKAWPVAGDPRLGARFRAEARRFVLGAPFGKTETADVKRIKEQVDRKIALRFETHRHVKLGTGGIREIELVTQVAQLRLGRPRGPVRIRGTLAALAALRDEGALAAEEHDVLAEAYRFLRDVENKLQMVSDSQVHALPDNPAEMRACALRMGYRDQGALPASEALLADYRRHTKAVHRLYEKAMQGEERR